MPNTSTDFAAWIDLFVEEKGLDVHREFIIPCKNKAWGNHFISLEVVIDSAKNTTRGEQQLIKQMLVKHDYHNADPMQYFEHLAACLAR